MLNLDGNLSELKTGNMCNNFHSPNLTLPKNKLKNTAVNKTNFQAFL